MPIGPPLGIKSLRCAVSVLSRTEVRLAGHFFPASRHLTFANRASPCCAKSPCIAISWSSC
jgi:hypothetical protein